MYHYHSYVQRIQMDIGKYSGQHTLPHSGKVDHMMAAANLPT